MQVKKILLVYLMILLIQPFVFINIDAQEIDPPTWNKNWSYRQEINIPINTNSNDAKNQPIDININFNNPCWTKNEKESSIRVLCWYKQKWNELESQIYDLRFEKTNFLSSCGLVFLIPGYADGEEKYFLYYDNTEKNPALYPDHVGVEDAYYYYEPISGIAAEGDYYKIIEDDFIVYGIGQKGKAIYRTLSQAIVKQKPETKEFSLIDSDNILSFCFSYHKGVNDEDEITSDYSLISKEICTDGNLMVEFKIDSKSQDEKLKTYNHYKYYYCPTENKKINVHVKHEILKDCKVEGVKNVDGRFGALITYQSKSERIQKMRFGEILPFLHIPDEENKIREYKLNTDPESKDREWVISYEDDCDIGSEAWISYDQGDNGKAHGIIFSKNTDILQGKDEKDGIQIKVAEKEYLDAIGAEIDYGAINFGRNSFEKNNGEHDIYIPKGLVIEFDAEFFTSEKGGYQNIKNESKIFKELIKYRHTADGTFNGGSENIYTATIEPTFTGRLFSNPILRNIAGINITSIYAELYKDDKLISSEFTSKPLFSLPKIKFPKLSKGEYKVKIFRKIGDNIKNFIGFEAFTLEEDKTIKVFCTWSRKIKVNIENQESNSIENIELLLYKNDSLIESNLTSAESETIFVVPFLFKKDYRLIANFKGFEIFNSSIPIFKNNIKIDLNLYDLELIIKDTLGFPPGVNLNTYLTSNEMADKKQIFSENLGFGRYIFRNIPGAEYDFYLIQGSHLQKIKIQIPNKDNIIDIDFTAKYNLLTDLFDRRGNQIDKLNKKIIISRENEEIISEKEISNNYFLPPGEYEIKVFSEDKLIGIKNIELTNDKKIKIVTITEPIMPKIATILIIIFIGEISILLIFRKISLNTFLKLLAMSLILLSLFHPWWNLFAQDLQIDASKTTELFILPRSMIDTVYYNEKVYLDMATIPDLFTNFLGGLILIVLSGFVLMGLSFIPNIFYKKRFSPILISASIIFTTMVVAAFLFGMSKITEISLGKLQGSGILDIVLPDKSTVYMQSTWGLGIGFYLCFAAALTGLIAGIIDYIRKRRLLEK